MNKRIHSPVLLHDWLTGFRGGERILEAFCELFPKAPIYTLIHKPGSTCPTIEEHPIKTSFLNKIPGIEEQYRKFLPLFPLAAESLTIAEETNLVLSSSHCVIKGVKKPPGSIHVSYIHSPMRYLYDQFDAYFGHQAPLYQQVGAKVFRGYLTQWDLQSNSNVDHIIANSSFVQNRIKEIYKRDSVVIHPFVDLEDIRKYPSTAAEKHDYYLMVTAFAPNKRVDLAIATFNELNLPLKIIGSGQLEKQLRADAKTNIEFLGNVSRYEVISHMTRARAFIFPGVEDFGITPLESLACGTPVIAYKAGGVLETLTHETAVFFDTPSITSLKEAVKAFQTENFTTESLRLRAEEFSKERFINQIKSFIETVSK